MLTAQIKLLPTNEQQLLLRTTMEEYISLINDIVDYAIALGDMPKLSSAMVNAPLPACLRDQCRIDARSIWRKTLKHKWNFPTLKKPVAIWNNQNYRVFEDRLEFPVLVNGKSKRIAVKASIPEDAYALLSSRKLGTLRITCKNHKFIAQIAYKQEALPSVGSEIMGVDLGIKCPAAAVMSDGTRRFYGNGRKNKYVRRYYAKRRKKLGKAKKLAAIRKANNKEQRWMRDVDHKISRAIVNDAIHHSVKVIKLEALSGIRSAARRSRKNNRSLHSWSFYRLASYIKYKARLAGIEVEYTNPAFTSQTCPCCGARNHADDRRYTCSACGFQGHRDLVGAVNILAA